MTFIKYIKKIVFIAVIYNTVSSIGFSTSISCMRNYTLEKAMQEADGAVLAELKWTIPLSFFGTSYLYNLEIYSSWKSSFPKSYWWRVKNLGDGFDETFGREGKFIAFFYDGRISTGRCSHVLPATDEWIEKLNLTMGKLK